jgi:hypothetical protein
MSESETVAELDNDVLVLARALRDSRAENERLRAALRECDCPRPINSRPPDVPVTVGDCYDAGECGCVHGDALK